MLKMFQYKQDLMKST